MQRATTLLALLFTLGLVACDDRGHDHSEGDHDHEHAVETPAQPESGNDHGHAHAEEEGNHSHGATQDVPQTETFYGEEADTPETHNTMTSDDAPSQTHDHDEGEHDHQH